MNDTTVLEVFATHKHRDSDRDMIYCHGPRCYNEIPVNRVTRGDELLGVTVPDYAIWLGHGEGLPHIVCSKTCARAVMSNFFQG